MRQQQFLEVLDRDEAERRWQAALRIEALESESVPLAAALGRVLAEDVRSPVDVPSFDRSNMDGFALRAEDTFGAAEETPVPLRLNPESVPTGVEPRYEVRPGTATAIATGGMMPRGADAVVPVELTDVERETVLVRAPRVPGDAVSWAGTDIGRGETVFFGGTLLASRETGVLAAIGAAQVTVVRRPRVAVLSTGDEIITPGEPMRPGLVYDSNGRILADALVELGAEPRFLGCFRDDLDELRRALRRALESCDAVVLSGGTSKGEGDLCYRAVAELEPGILVHGVALKPGKPICLAAARGKPVAILPGFPTSAIFTFHELVAPVIRSLSGLAAAPRSETVQASLASRLRSEKGRLEYVLVSLVRATGGGLVAYPMGKGSGSVTTWSRADGFVRVERATEIVEAGEPMEVTLLGRSLEPADLIIIGSHCTGLDLLAGELSRGGVPVKVLAVGSRGGLEAARRGECDVAPLHLLDPESGEYNRPFLDDDLELVPGYCRIQGVVTRPGDERTLDGLLADPRARMVNRNHGSGTRVLIDRLLGDRRPDGFGYETRSHNAVAAAVAQGRADWGVTIEPVARAAGLRFLPLEEERFDFAVPKLSLEKPAVRAWRALLAPGSEARERLAAAGFPATSGPVLRYNRPPTERS